MYVVLAKSLKKYSITANSQHREVRKIRDCAHSGCNPRSPHRAGTLRRKHNVASELPCSMSYIALA